MRTSDACVGVVAVVVMVVALGGATLLGAEGSVWSVRP